MSDFLTISFDKSKISFAWSLVVAAEYISAPLSLSAMRKYRPRPANRDDLPFFLPTDIYAVLNLLGALIPFPFFQPKRLAIINCSHGSSNIGRPAHSPLMWLKWLKKSITLSAVAESKYNPLLPPLFKSSRNLRQASLT